jgi:hypothetical protein
MRYFFSHIITALCLTVMLTHAHAADNRALKPSNKAEEGRRVALVIGNSDYTNSPLKNPVNDAKDVASKLRGLGFDVIERNNLKTKQIGGTLREFRSKLSPGAVALVFYAGHGLQIKGDNYLPAVDADINSEEDVPNQSLSMKQIMDVLDESKARLNLVFLDACRNNPYASRSFRSADRGLARVSAPSGTLISYATRPGSVAADGNGRNGLYTSKLLAQMSSSLQIELALKRVVTEVKSASQGKQEPWMEGSIEGDFCFGGCASVGVSQVASIAPVLTGVQAKSREQIEDEYWDAIKGSNDLAGFEQYLRSYPAGRYVGIANLKIVQLKNQTNTTSVPPTARKSEVHVTNSSDVLVPNNWQKLANFSFDKLMLRFAKGNYREDSNMRIALTNKEENGAVIQFKIDFGLPLGASDKVVVIVNEKIPAYLLIPQGTAKLSHFTARVKVPGSSGTIRAILVDADGNLKTSVTSVNVPPAGVMDSEYINWVSKNEPSEPPKITLKHKEGLEDGLLVVKVLSTYPSNFNHYTESILADFYHGNIVVYLTPIATKNPFAGFSVDPSKVSGIKIVVTDNKGTSVTESGSVY